MDDEMQMSRVYVKTDSQNRIVRIEGEYTLSNIVDMMDWVLIEEGAPCDRLNLAQSQYFPGGLYTEDGVPRYKLVDGQPVERTEEEIQQDLEILISNAPLSNDLQTKLAIAELAELENAHDLENKLAIAELAELLLGGDK